MTDRPYGSIQWKGTEVCIDLHCGCGTDGHLDVNFDLYQVRCVDCGQAYSVGTDVVLTPLAPADVRTDTTVHHFDDGD